MGGCSFDAFYSKLSETVSRSSLSSAPVASQRTCEHDDVVDGFAYIDLWNQHWPVRVCKTCRLILKGRDPNIEERDVPAWEMSCSRPGSVRRPELPDRTGSDSLELTIAA